MSPSRLISRLTRRARAGHIPVNGGYDARRAADIPRPGYSAQRPDPSNEGTTLARCGSAWRSAGAARGPPLAARRAGAAERRSPARCSRRSTASPWTRSRAVCRTARRSSAPRTARRRRPRWSAEILAAARPPRAQPRGREPRLRRRLGARRRRRTPSWGSSRWTRPRFPRSRGARTRARSSSANLFRDQLDRYGELEIVAERWRAAIADARSGRDDVVVNADDPLLADLVRARGNAVRFGLSDPSVARERLPHAADSKYCVVCGTPYDVRRHLRRATSAPTAARRGDDERPPLDVDRPRDPARRSRRLRRSTSSPRRACAASGSRSQASITSTTRSQPPAWPWSWVRRSTTLRAV